MLSVLIPVYNFDVRAFVADLSKQTHSLSQPCEIICLDDGSEPSFRELNVVVGSYQNVRYLESQENLGRSKVRNRLEQEAQYELLLFLDCDGKVVRPDYLKRYLKVGEADVVYGGRVYQEDRPVEANLNFHWYCGMAREEVPVQQRMLTPYKSFMTNNFMIKRSVYNDVRMDESVEGYGHEDTLFAMELKRSGYKILHIDNPLEHIGIEDVDVFLEKSANGVRNLALLMKRGKVDDTIKLVRFYRRLKSYFLLGLVAWIVERFEKRMLNNLRSAAPNLLWFDLWKLARLHRAMQS